MDHTFLDEALDLLHQAITMHAAMADCIARAENLIHREVANGKEALENRPQPHGTGHPPIIDHGTLSVRWNGKSCVLGATIPLRLMERLCRRPNCFIRHEDLFRDVWNAIKSPNTVRSTVRRLKRQLEKAGMPDLSKSICCEGGRYAFVLHPRHDEIAQELHKNAP